MLKLDLISQFMVVAQPEIKHSAKWRWPMWQKTPRLALPKNIYGHTLNHTFLKAMLK